jgi:RNA polymerase sigma factor (sigma-70 family)
MSKQQKRRWRPVPMPASSLPSELIERVLAGVASAFDELIQALRPWMVRVAEICLIDKASAEDVAQDVSIELPIAIARHPTLFKANPIAFIRSRILWKAGEYNRRTTTRRDREGPPMSQIDSPNATTSMLDRIPGRELDPLDVVQKLELEVAIAESVQKLPKELREVVEIHGLLGFTLAETAEMLDITRARVAGRWRAALRKLRALLAAFA